MRNIDSDKYYSVVLRLNFGFGLVDGFGFRTWFGLDPDVHDETPLNDDFEDEKGQENGRCDNGQSFLE